MSERQAMFQSSEVEAHNAESTARSSCDVVITTRNRPAALRRCLEGLRRQSISGFGVIVVDDCSDPPVSETFDGEAFVGLDVEQVTLDQPSGPAAGRNAGVAASSADFIVFVDDDVVASRHFVAAHLEAVTSDSASPIVSCGPFVQPADWEPTPWNLWEARQAKKEADNLMKGVFEVTWRQFHTGNNCLSRPVFVELGGFDERFKRSEDDEFALRLHRHGCVFHFEPAAIAWHYSNRTLESWLAIPRSYAHYDVEIDRENPEFGYLDDKKAELARRQLPLRVARAVFAGPQRTRVGVVLAVTAARLLYRFNLVDPAMGALSVAYDLSYVDALRESERARSTSGTSRVRP